MSERGVLAEPAMDGAGTSTEPTRTTTARAGSRGRAPGRFRKRRSAVIGTQLVLIVLFLAAWQYLPQVEALSSRFRFLDPFFISSPSDTAQRIYDIATGNNDTVTIWPYLWHTLEASLVGVLIGIGLGGGVGLVLSAMPFVARVLRPFISAINATPRVALIPVIVILFGPTQGSSIVVSVLVVFFVAFFNAFEGGTTIAPHLVQNAQVLGASQSAVMLRVRLPYVLAWTMAAIPVALAFSLLSVVTAEILTGNPGIGRLITQATSTVDAALTFSVVIYLAVLGASLVALADLLKRRVLHWWVAGG